MNQMIDESTEDVVLGSLVLNPDEYNAVAQYIPDVKVFSQRKARALWLKISDMVQKCEPIDTLTVCNTVTGDDRRDGISKSYIVDCTSEACALGMTEVYAQTIYEKYYCRRS